MPIDLVDLASQERYGPFNTPAEAKTSAARSGFVAYELWEDGKRIERVVAPPRQDDGRGH